MQALNAVVLNERKLNFDGKISFDALEEVTALSRHEETSTEQVRERDAVKDIRGKRNESTCYTTGSYTATVLPVHMVP